jgi:4,5-dihydroxyphthalate decarboxylase
MNVGRVPIALAISDYEHVRDLTTGVVEVGGVDLTCLELSVEEIFYRFTEFREWHASEMSMARYVSMRAAGDDSLTAIPVFPSRVFRHSSFYVTRDSPIEEASELAGKRVGIPEWAQTAGVYARGLLTHEYGVPLTDVRWTQGGVNQAGRRERVPVAFPDGVEVEVVTDRSLNEMLLAGDLDAVISARPPLGFSGDGSVRRLYDDFQTLEADYVRRTGIFPIMHTIVTRRDLLRERPGLAHDVYGTFSAAKDAAADRYRRNRRLYQVQTMVPWMNALIERNTEQFAEDWWPYGISANRATLETYLRYHYEQGLSSRRWKVEEVFSPELLDT